MNVRCLMHKSYDVDCSQLIFCGSFVAVGFVVEPQVETIRGLLLLVIVVEDLKKMISKKPNVQNWSGTVMFIIMIVIKLTLIPIRLKLS